MSRISRYIFISILLLSFQVLNAQDLIIKKEKESSIQSGLSLGVDIAPLIIIAFQPERKGIGFIGRYVFKRNWFVVGEFGFENINFEKPSYDYISNGGYLKIGSDYNFFKTKDPDNNDNITLGIRYGIATQTHQSPRFTIIDDYWGDYVGSFATSNVTSQWLEFVAGIRTEVFKNFFMGWTFRIKTVLGVRKVNDLEPYTIPGYGIGDNKVNIGFTYTLEYQIPFKTGKKKQSVTKIELPDADTSF